MATEHADLAWYKDFQTQKNSTELSKSIFEKWSAVEAKKMEQLLPHCAGEFLKQSFSKIVLLQAKKKYFHVYTKHVAQLGWCFSTDDHKNK